MFTAWLKLPKPCWIVMVRMGTLVLFLVLGKCFQFFTIEDNVCCGFIISSIQFSHPVVSDSLQPHESQHARPPCPSPTPRVYSNSCPLSQWCHPANSSSVIPLSSCPQALPASVSFPMSQLFAWGGQSTGVSASAAVLPMNTQDWSPLGWTGWISLQSEHKNSGSRRQSWDSIKEPTYI